MRWTPASSRIAVVLGAALLAGSLTLPWLTARSALVDMSVVPISNDVAATGVWLMMLWIVLGAAIFLVSGSPAIIGGAGALAFNLSAAVWLAGAKASLVLPLDIVPDNAAASLETGASLGLLGSVLIVAGSVFALAGQTWSLPPVHLPTWVWPSALVLLLASLLAREFDWVKVEADSVNWALDFGAIPVLGDGVAAVLLTTIALVVLYVLRPRRWVTHLIIGVAVLAAVAAVVALTSSVLLERGVNALFDRIGDIGIEDPQITAMRGPWAVLVFAAGTLVFGLVARHQFIDGEKLPVAPKQTTAAFASVQPAGQASELPF